MKKALICVVSGQDGSYLAKFLLEKGYRVFGASRDAQNSSFINLTKLGIKEDITLISINITDFGNTLECINKDELNYSSYNAPNLIYKSKTKSIPLL